MKLPNAMSITKPIHGKNNTSNAITDTWLDHIEQCVKIGLYLWCTLISLWSPCSINRQWKSKGFRFNREAFGWPSHNIELNNNSLSICDSAKHSTHLKPCLTKAWSAPGLTGWWPGHGAAKWTTGSHHRPGLWFVPLNGLPDPAENGWTWLTWHDEVGFFWLVFTTVPAPIAGVNNWISSRSWPKSNIELAIPAGRLKNPICTPIKQPTENTIGNHELQ